MSDGYSEPHYGGTRRLGADTGTPEYMAVAFERLLMHLVERAYTQDADRALLHSLDRKLDRIMVDLAQTQQTLLQYDAVITGFASLVSALQASANKLAEVAANSEQVGVNEVNAEFQNHLAAAKATLEGLQAISAGGGADVGVPVGATTTQPPIVDPGALGNGGAGGAGGQGAAAPTAVTATIPGGAAAPGLSTGAVPEPGSPTYVAPTQVPNGPPASEQLGGVVTLPPTDSGDDTGSGDTGIVPAGDTPAAASTATPAAPAGDPTSTGVAGMDTATATGTSPAAAANVDTSTSTGTSPAAAANVDTSTSTSTSKLSKSASTGTSA